jgi:hypothetical protein
MNAFDFRIVFYVAVLFSSSLARAGSQVAPLKVTLCDLYIDPQKYAGKMVEIQATITGYRQSELGEPVFAPQAHCSSPGYMIIGLEFPRNVKPSRNST